MPKALWTLFLCLCLGTGYASAQQKKDIIVRGLVTNAQGDPLEGVLVENKESRMFTLTERDGRFTLELPDSRSDLIFTLEGYDPVETFVAQTGNSRYCSSKPRRNPIPKSPCYTARKNVRSLLRPLPLSRDRN